jgi:3-oxoacyl-[acyl-carrier-protein] synthase-1
LIHAAVDSAACGRQPPVWVIHDMNGEGYRAGEWGNALFRLASVSNELANLVPWFPAVSMGDVGAATGAIHACFAMEAAHRGYSPNHLVTLTAASESAKRSCVSLSTGIPLFAS